MEDGDAYELVDGRLVELNLGAQSQVTASILTTHIGQYLQQHPIGIVGAELGLKIFPEQVRKLRRPDVAFLSWERLPDGVPTGNITTPPDLAVEVTSPGDKANEVETKVQEYFAAGVRLVWVIYPQTRTVLVRRRDGTALTLAPEAELSGEDVLPGFAVKVNDLFPPAGPPANE
jgi:Uma2 family endonuclease